MHWVLTWGKIKASIVPVAGSHDAPEARLVLKHQSDGLALPVLAEVPERLREFFPLFLRHWVTL